jgi:putative transposase
MCRVLGVSRAGYYAAQARPLSPRAEADVALTTRIAVVHAESRGTYGAPRVQARLQQDGFAVSEKRIARLMRAAGLMGRVPRRWRAPGPSDRDTPIPNRLARDFAPAAPLNTRWAADITYLPYAGGLAYLAVVLDLSSRRVIGWRVAPHLQTDLPLGALQQALATRPRPQLHHSDRGSQYVSGAYQAHLQAHQITPSLSAVGNCYDNAVVESFFSTLKRECPVHACRTRAELTRLLETYIDGWYNPHRLHSSLQYQSPLAYEQRLTRRPRVA